MNSAAYGDIQPTSSIDHPILIVFIAQKKEKPSQTNPVL
ncbi:hypothetical protein C1A50_4021 [Paenibacillus polymyxa]|jgi:hypothetical protein|nr:hypothetical protein C1A50_4021 [Paenibacillus polymyxa]